MAAATQPGKLYTAGLDEMAKYLGQREGAEGGPALGDPSAKRVMGYLTSVFHGQFPKDRVGLRTSREMATIATALDAISAGKLPQVADVLMQRFKALEQSVQDGGWDTAQHLELIPRAASGLASSHEVAAAAKEQLAELKLIELRKPKKWLHWKWPRRYWYRVVDSLGNPEIEPRNTQS